MDDLTDKISALLGDEGGMERIRQMAENLLGGEKNVAPPEPAPSVPDIDFTRLLPLIQRLNSPKNDNRSSLLMALRPHLSEKRQQRLDRAVKLLRLADMLPLVQDSGIFKL